MEETEEEKAAREAEEAAAAEAEAAEKAAAEEAKKAEEQAALDALTPEERAAKEAEAEKAAEEAKEKTDEVVVQIGDEKPPEEEKAPSWVREVRQRNRELEKKNRELERQLHGQQQSAKVGRKPEMSDPDIDYDADKFEKALAAHLAQKRKAEEEAERIAAAQKVEQNAWQKKLDAYGTAKTDLKVPDLDEAESLVQETLSEKQQAIILKGAKNPALLVYAIGKNPAKLKELAGVTDLVEFAFAIANLESQLKVTKKAPPPAPERKVEGTGAKSGLDSTLEKLRAEAEKTGDYTKVNQYRNQKKAA